MAIASNHYNPDGKSQRSTKVKHDFEINNGETTNGKCTSIQSLDLKTSIIASDDQEEVTLPPNLTDDEVDEFEATATHDVEADADTPEDPNIPDTPEKLQSILNTNRSWQ